jgi:hypothetical protein
MKDCHGPNKPNRRQRKSQECVASTGNAGAGLGTLRGLSILNSREPRAREVNADADANPLDTSSLAGCVSRDPA